MTVQSEISFLVFDFRSNVPSPVFETVSLEDDKFERSIAPPAVN